VSDLAVSSFATAAGDHVVECPRSKRFADFLGRFDETAERSRLASLGLQYVGRSEPTFPPLLRAIHDPPAGLYVRGAGLLELLARPAIAIVGARNCSGYGRSVARTLARELAGAGLVVVSGLARGIDGEAHRGALDAEGTTVGVLGCGIDRDYPAGHAELAGRVCERSILVSEYGPGVEPAPWRFPARNRIVAGLCAATVVVEARERSGALITADFALDEGREVFAVPGEITSALSAGTNALLRLGATPLTKPDDVLETFGLEGAGRPSCQLSAAAATLLTRLADTPSTADELSRTTALDPAQVSAGLTELELAGLVTEAAGVYRTLAPAAGA
jgi:DNA processing protein